MPIPQDTTPLREHCRKLLMPVRCELHSLRHSRIVVVVFYDGVEKLLAQYIHKNNSERKGTKKNRQTCSNAYRFYTILSEND